MNKLNSIIFNKVFWSMIVVNILIMIIGEALYASLIILLLYGGISTTIVLLVIVLLVSNKTWCYNKWSSMKFSIL
ncbi:MAG: hypothetical protein ACK5HR_02720 [Mycoplasmatales bacterium]